MDTNKSFEENKIEILAPAGSLLHLKAAVYGGADAVYLGTKEFSARSSAVNFTYDELEESVEFCHTYGVNVYVAVNTLIKTSELEKLVPLAKKLGEINVDGVIVQDLSVARVFKEVCPQMKLHGSTQMAIHNLAGALALADMGFSRVVLARELTFEEIKEITEKCGIETEVFVHGAHCMSASGMCYLSSFIGGRSGNRGRCAQPCRLDFKSGKKNYSLSLKDMCYIDHVKSLAEIGVSSLKIEGRMKRPEYAYIASKTYRKALDGKPFENEIKLLKGVFSRSGFTDGYIANKRNADMFGYRSKEDVEAATDALKAIGKIDEIRKIPVSAVLKIKDGDYARLTVFSEGKSVSVFSEQRVLKSTLLPAVERIEESLKKTGNTPFEMTDISINIELVAEETDKAFPVSAFNALRRSALENLAKEISKREEIEINDYVIPDFQKRKDKKIRPEIRIRVEKADQLKEIKGFIGKIIIPYDEAMKLDGETEKENVILELPCLIYPFSEDKILNSLMSLKKMGYEKVLCENISFIGPLKYLGFEVYGGAYLNVTNPLALCEYEKMGIKDTTLSIEINSGDISAFGNSSIGVIAYGFLPLMQLRVCPVKASLGCEKCGKNGSVKDRLNKEFSILCKGDFVSLLNTVPLYLWGKELFVDFITLYFTKETPAKVKNVLDSFIKGSEPDYPHTKGLYFRKVL